MEIKIYCRAKWIKARDAARVHNDKTLDSCILRLMSFLEWNNSDMIAIDSDFGEHTFAFAVIREDGSVSMNGGIVFHGFPEDGYMENGSTMIEPDYGWHIHT